jgi:hypothetical protein
MVVPHELYRDLSAACEVCEGSRSRAVIDVDVVDEHMASAECSTKSDALKRELGFWASAALAWAQHREWRPTLNYPASSLTMTCRATPDAAPARARWRSSPDSSLSKILCVGDLPIFHH